MRGHAQDVGDTIIEFNRAMGMLCRGEKEQALDALKRSSWPRRPPTPASNPCPRSSPAGT